MSNSVPLEALTTALDDLDAPLEKYVLISGAKHLHRSFEYLWGLNAFEFDETHERNIIYLRKSLHARLRQGWTLIPTIETLTAMRALVGHNSRCPLTERKSFLSEFSAPEYEYMFLPMDIQEEIIVDGRCFSPPYQGFPRIRCSANPFFVAYQCEGQIILSDSAVCSKAYLTAYFLVSSDWHGGYPKSFVGEPESSDSDSDEETQWSDSSEDSVPAPALPPPSRTPVTKQSRIANWVKSNADPELHEPAMEPLKSPLKARKPRPDSKAAWRRDSVLGQRWTEQLFE
ncbi:hypothetical protein C8J56DRAFT_1162594 [Mycena floridula]|nr:hypothetical protein C8J56DRAFT_1162594 [Mycena floridula]